MSHFYLFIFSPVLFLQVCLEQYNLHDMIQHYHLWQHHKPILWSRAMLYIYNLFILHSGNQEILNITPSKQKLIKQCLKTPQRGSEKKMYRSQAQSVFLASMSNVTAYSTHPVSAQSSSWYGNNYQTSQHFLEIFHILHFVQWQLSGRTAGFPPPPPQYFTIHLIHIYLTFPFLKIASVLLICLGDPLK